MRVHSWPKCFVRYLPNIITATRMALSPWFFLMLWRRQYGAALIFCFLAGVSDGVDGFLARRFAAGSKLGAVLDPISDKILLSGAFLVLAIDGAIERWLAVLVLGRDLLILAAAGFALLFTSVRSFPPAFPGKASTTAQIIYIVTLLLHFNGFVSAGLVETAKWFVVGWAIVSVIDYARRGRAAIMKK
jgi:cardiolipin synthase (CMP-forming)